MLVDAEFATALPFLSAFSWKLLDVPTLRVVNGVIGLLNVDEEADVGTLRGGDVGYCNGSSSSSSSRNNGVLRGWLPTGGVLLC